MDASESARMAEAVEAGLRDGRSLDSLRKAMRESGYSEEDIKGVISRVDRHRIVRKPQRKNKLMRRSIPAIVAGILIAIIILGIFVLTQEEGRPASENTSRNESESVGEKTICYIVNESVKDFMVEAGAKCDKWILIREL